MNDDLRWWRADEADIGRRMIARANDIENRQQFRRDAFLHYARLYVGNEIDDLDVDGYSNYGNFATLGGPSSYMQSDVTYNVVKQLGDTLVAKIAKNRPLPMFLTSGGDWSQQRRAKGKTKYVEGQFDACRVFEELTPSVVLDTVIFGSGFAKPYLQDDAIRVDRVFPWEIIVDDNEAMGGDPRSLYHKKRIDRMVLAELYPEQREAIMTASDPWRYSHPTTTRGDQLVVVEGWHLRSGPNAEDGRHVIAIGSVTLSEEPYERDYFPIVRLTMAPPVFGYYGIGLGEILTAIQYEINFTALRIQRAHNIMGGSHWLVPSGSMNIKHIDNDFGSIFGFTGSPPTPVVTQPIHPDVYSYLESLLQRASYLSGVSQLSATSQKPAGLNSGKALQTYDDIETERFMTFGRNFEAFSMNLARQMIDLARDLAKENPKYAVKAKRGRELQDVVFLDVDLPDDAAVMQVFPISMLSKTPAARMQQVQDLFSMGLIDQSNTKRLLDFPDLEDAASLDTASFDLCSQQIERMLDDGEEQWPIPEMNLAEAHRLAQLSIVRAKLRNVPEPNIELCRRYAMNCQDLMAPPPAAAAPPPPPEGAAPPPDQGAAPPPPPDQGAPPPI